jgi:hypothetical protein
VSAGYSGTPLARKLGIKQGSRVAVLGAPEGLAALLKPLPDGARVQAWPLVDNKICAIDEDWSGLRFVVRLEHWRARETSTSGE